MTACQPFNPAFRSTREITATTGGGSTVIDSQRLCRNMRMVNLSANVIWVRTWDSRNTPAPTAVAAAGATIGDYPVAPNQTSTITFEKDHDTLYWIAETGNSRMLVTTGEGW